MAITAWTPRDSISDTVTSAHGHCSFRRRNRPDWQPAMAQINLLILFGPAGTSRRNLSLGLAARTPIVAGAFVRAACECGRSFDA